MLSRISNWIKQKSNLNSERNVLFSWLKNYAACFEDIITWKNPIHSIIALLIVNIVYIFLSVLAFHPLGYFFAIAEIFAIMDATGMKFSRNRRVFVKAGTSDGRRTCEYVNKMESWVKNKAADFITLRENNPTKAFIVMNLILCAIFVIGEKLSLAKLLYIFIMTLMAIPFALPYLQLAYYKLYPQTDDNEEIADLLPEVCEQSLRELNFAEEDPPDQGEKFDALLPKTEDQLDGPDISEEDSSSSSIGSSFSGAALLKEFDTSSDESGNEEFIPKVTFKQEDIKSTVKEIEDVPHAEGWSDRAVTAVWNIGGTLSSMVYAASSYRHKNDGYKRATQSEDSADEFEIIDENECNK